ncbi:MAG: SH3 domain-containing protein [Desulfobaccales bacterium]|nr:SH3 domain-containing protein [Desulfobaccales bacterium]
MRRPAFVRKPALWLMVLGLAAWLLGPAPGWGETLKVTQSNQSLYPSADFAGTPIGPVPMGAEVSVVEKAGEWYKVEYQGKTGWLPRQAFPAPQTGSKFPLGGILFGGPVKETKSDEVALAGKGFTPEVESVYRQKHPEMQFAQVDRVEANRVDEAQMQAFIKEGGLRP